VIELEFRNVDFCGGRKPGEPGEKPSWQGRKPTHQAECLLFHGHISLRRIHMKLSLYLIGSVLEQLNSHEVQNTDSPDIYQYIKILY
jgi:hypothetical protein